METNLPLISSVAGIILGLALVFLNIKTSRSLTGSFFKKYYKWMIIGSIFFTFGFATETAEVFGANDLIAEGLHNILLVLSVIIFAFSSIELPKEANKYMQSQQKI